jgi:hypothetical protein
LKLAQRVKILHQTVRFSDLELPLSGIGGTGTSRSHLLRNLGQISHRKQSRKSWEIDERDLILAS